MSPPESTIEKHFCKRVADLGGIERKVTTLGRRGFFDRLAVIPPGLVCFVELKRPKGGVVSEHQKRRHDEFRAVDAEVYLLYTIEQVDEWYYSMLVASRLTTRYKETIHGISAS